MAGESCLSPGKAGASKTGCQMPAAQDWGAGNHLGTMGLMWLGGLGWSLTSFISCTLGPTCLCFSGLVNLEFPLMLGLPCTKYVCPQLVPSLMQCKYETVEEAAQWASISFKEITPVLATGRPCTLLAKEINRSQQWLKPQELFTAGLLSLPRNGGCIYDLNMVTSSLCCYIPVAAW